MTPAALITEVLLHTDNVDGYDITNTNRRARALSHLQSVCEEVCNERQFTFLEATESVDIDAGDITIPLTSSFEIGWSGHVYNSSLSKEYEEITPKDLVRMRGDGLTDQPYFAVFGGVIQITSHSAATFLVTHSVRTFAGLTDDDSADIPVIPVHYHRTVLLAGVISHIQRGKNDPRSEFEQLYRRGLAQMVVREESKKSSISQLPLSMGGHW